MNLEWKREKPQDNMLAGAVGAFLGSLIGVACIVLVDRLGYVAAICGMVMAVCSIKGYTLLGGRFSKRGAVISGLMILVMTYIANKLCFSLTVWELVSDEGIGFFEVYQKLHLLWEDGEIRGLYLRSLVMLYLFTLVGGIPTIVSAIREPRDQAEAQDTAEDLKKAEAALNAEFYPFQKKWMRPLRLSVNLPVLVLILMVVGVTLASAAWEWAEENVLLVAGGLLSVPFLFCLTLPTLLLCNTFTILYVRAGGKLWRVDLHKFAGVQDWEKLTPSRQAMLKYEILQEIRHIAEGKGLTLDAIMHQAFGDAWPDRGHQVVVGQRMSAIILLEDMRVEKETKWSWKASYETEMGRRKKLNIPKGHPGFCPDPALEMPQGPVPCRWSMVPVALLVMAAAIGCSYGVGTYLDGWTPANRPNSQGTIQQEEQPAAVAKDVPARVPENITEYEMSEVWFQMDRAFQYGRRTFLDGETGTTYRAYVQYGVDGSDAWDTLAQDISKYRISPLYDRFDAVYLDSDPLTPLNETSRYNIVSVYLTDGWVFHTAAVLADSGTLFTIEAAHDSSAQSVEEVLANLMFTLESVRFEGPAVTEENYQSQIHISEIRDCAYMAAAYIKTDLFGHDAFVDVYVPYSETPVYAANGRSIRTEAHGLRVYASILPGENAKDVIEARHQELAAAGQIYEEGAVDEEYREDLDAACKLTTYKENGQERYAVLYADKKWEGYYLLREITGLPELVDEEYPALLAELEGIIGLTMPVLEDLGA